MSYLKCQTMAGVSPQGKPRVFFSCHPDDFAEYSQKVFYELFSYVNCAIYYMDPTEKYDLEEVLQDVSQMQLFVFAVTKKLLLTPNPGMDKLFPFAEQLHIPVLPLVQEEVEPRTFSKRFGDLQYLSRADITATSISYEEKLKKYLDSVLANDKLTQKVREALDAYIFLSYRKKDRVYAQKLMKKIHEADFCRDVAIWYDEFLVPGENYNNAIGEMIEKSDLFALAVTPNLVNEINYVQTTEYPAAFLRGKTVLAAEMVKTSRAMLESQYKEIPPCVDPDDKKRFEKELAQKLPSLQGHPLKDDSEHLYYMGLAYLGGIDVEVDHEKAVSLITASSDKGYSEATLKLVSMYKNGDGVARSYQKAIELQNHYISVLEKFYEAVEQIRVSSQLAEALRELSSLYEAARDKNACRSTLKKLIRLCEQYDQAWGYPYKLAATQLLGDLARSEGNFQEAKQYYLDTLAQCQNDLDKGRNAGAVFAAQSYLMLGNLCATYHDREEAKSYYLKAVALADQYKDKHDFTSTYLIAYQALGNLATETGNLSVANDYLQKTQDLYLDLQKSGKKVAGSLAGLMHEKNELEQAQKYRKSLDDIYRAYRIHMSSDPEQDKKDFKKMQSRIQELDRLNSQNMNYSSEIEKRKEALETMKEYATSSEIADRRKYADECIVLGLVQIQNNEYEEAEPLLRKALGFYEEYGKTHGDDEVRLSLMSIYTGLFEIAVSKGDPAEETRLGDKVLALNEEAVKKRGNARDYVLLINSYIDRGAKEKAHGHLDKAEKMIKKAIDAGKELVRKDPGRNHKELLSASYYALAYLRSDAKPDKDPLLSSYRIMSEMQKDFPDDQKILKEMSKIRASLMKIGVKLSEIDKLAKKAGKTGWLSRLFGKNNGF